jgi:phage gp16-like protein
MTTKKTPKRRQAKKRTSDRVSTLAAKLMTMRRMGFRFYAADGKVPWGDVTRLVDAVAASCVGQDQVKGQRGTR